MKPATTAKKNTAFFLNAKQKLAELSGREYSDDLRSFRIILDHVRATTFLINDGAEPANSDAGYVTRRLLRRAIRAGRKIDIQGSFVGNWLRFILTKRQHTKI